MSQETKKNILLGSLVFALLVIAYSVYSYSQTYADSMMIRSFSVTGEAKINAVPDVAEFDFGVVTEGDTNVAKLQEQNTNKMNKIIDYLKSQKIEVRDIKTTGYNLNPRYQYSNCRDTGVCPPPTIIGYTISQNATIKIRDFKIIGEVLQGAVTNGANNVSQLRFTFDDRDSLIGQVKGEAVKKAQLKAEALAKTAGFRLGKLLSIEDNGNYYPPMPYGVGGAMDASFAKVELAPAPAIEPGSEDLTASVTLRYGIR
ncbi:MAG TPA: SIMPL domain-containing protein [Candidatus Paceibacterota bacterium]|nr:SIMPL domain-containing protein [Candidatus Paceibacterota bacterium]